MKLKLINAANAEDAPSAGAENRVPGGPLTGIFYASGDFGASGEVRIEVKNAAGVYTAYPELTWTSNASRELKFQPGAEPKLVAENCTSVTAELHLW